jgi:P27 family predicted phage terminase small subunit
LKKSTPAPAHLSKEAQRWWKKLVTEYEVTDQAGLLLMQTALEAFDRMREAQEALKTDGAVMTDRFGQRKQHPAVITERDSRSQMLAALRQLNLDVDPDWDGGGRPPGR